MVDWSEVKSESKYSKIQKVKVPKSEFKSILSNYPEVYPQIERVGSYKIRKHILSEVLEYNVVYYNRDTNEVEGKIFYRVGDKVVRLVE